jgi:nitrate reductase molybdenum cofactor assembly chaperone NarJ/NarW
VSAAAAPGAGTPPGDGRASSGDAPPIAADAALLLADLLSYPAPDLAARARAGASALPPDAAAAAVRCADALAALGPGGAEELYTATFDLGATASPYVGFVLCGEGPRRNALLAFLSETYASEGHPRGAELPDHLAEVLRYLAGAGASERASELAAVALRPAARAIAARLPPENPYHAALDALVRALAPAGPEEVAP